MNDSQQPKKMTMQSNGYPDLGSDEANEAEDICADDDRLLLPILFDHSNGTNENTSVDYSSLAPPIWLHVLCGLPIWFGCTKKCPCLCSMVVHPSAAFRYLAVVWDPVQLASLAVLYLALFAL